MRTLAGFCAILFIFISQTSGQWTAERFQNIENILNGIIINCQQLQDFLWQERQKYAPGNSTVPIQAAGLNVAYGSFITDVERRMASVEALTRKVTNNMQLCPDTPVAPPPPTSVVVESTTENNISTIVVRWEPPINADENLQYKVYFVPVDANGIQQSGEVVFRICDAAQTSASITDLSPRAQYQIRVGAVSGSVAEATSIPTTVKTPDIVPSAPRSLRGISANPNVVELSWSPPAVRGDIETYELYYEDMYLNIKDKLTVNPPVTQYRLTDLTEGTTYRLTVSARSNNGESAQSSPVDVKTQDFKPIKARNIKAKALNTTAIVVRWDPPRRRMGDGIIRGYLVNFTDADFNLYDEYRTSDATVDHAVLTGLTPATLYYIRVYAFTRRTIGAGSPVVTETTLAKSPSAPQNILLSLYREHPPVVELTWTPPTESFGRIKAYRLHWGVKGGVVRREIITPTVLIWRSDYLDDGLLHEFKLHAENEIGMGPPSVVSFRTKNRDPIVPPKVEVKRIKNPQTNTTTLRVTWMDPGVAVKGYRILYRKFEYVYTGRWKMMEIPPTLQVDIPVKQAGKSYIVVVRGIKFNEDVFGGPNVVSNGGMGGMTGVSPGQPFPGRGGGRGRGRGGGGGRGGRGGRDREARMRFAQGSMGGGMGRNNGPGGRRNMFI